MPCADREAAAAGAAAGRDAAGGLAAAGVDRVAGTGVAAGAGPTAAACGPRFGSKVDRFTNSGVVATFGIPDC